MSEKDSYIVTFKEHILGGTNRIQILAGCAEEAEEKAYSFMEEYIDREDLELLSTERVEIGEVKKTERK